MPPYKRQITAGDIPQVKPFDTARMLNSVARTGEAIGQATAQLARQNFQNHFEIESRKLLQESYERNRNNPRQLLAEQQKIRVNLLKALPDRQQRGEAAVRFEVQAAPYMQRAKENLYKQTFEEAQTSTLQYIEGALQSVRDNAAAFYGNDAAASGAALAATLADVDGVLQRIGTADERGNFYLTPAQRVLVQRKLNQAITQGARSYFDGLDAKGKVAFAKDYAQRAVQINTLDPNSPTGFGKTDISAIMDRETYEQNRAYFEQQSLQAQSDLLLEEGLDPLTNPDGDLYKAIDYVNAAKDAPLQARKEAGDVLYVQIARNAQVERLRKEQDKERVLDMAYGFMLDGDVKQAISLVRNSELGNKEKNDIIENFKKGQAARQDDPESYNALARGIVNGEIYNPSQILVEYGKGNITESTKNGLLSTLKQRQEPSFAVYQQAVKQVEKSFDKGLLGMMTPAESMAMTYILRELDGMYQAALRRNLSEEELADLFSPEKVTSVALKYQPSLEENAQSYMQRMAPLRDAFNQVAQAKPGQSIEDYLQEHDLSL